MGSEKYINLNYCSPRQRDGGSVFCKSILTYNNTKMSNGIHVNEGFGQDWDFGQCWRNLLLCPVRPTSGIGFPPSLERTDHAEILFLFSHLYVNCYTKLIKNIAPIGLCQMVLFSLLLSACQHNSSWAVLGCGFFLPHIFLQQYLSTSGFQFSTVCTFTPPPTISTSIHSCNSSCAILKCYYTSHLLSFTASAELSWLAFFWLYSPPSVNQGGFSATVTLM